MHLDLFDDGCGKLVYVQDWKMISYDFKEKTLRIIGSHDDIARIERETGVSFE